jgi:proteasome activator subunit 4
MSDIASLARIIVYSMSQDGIPSAPSFAPTPYTPFTPGHMTPMTPPTPAPGANGNLGDYLSHKLASKGIPRQKTYLAGSKALDSLSKLIASTESFFHPSNSGAWTTDASFQLSTQTVLSDNRYSSVHLSSRLYMSSTSVRTISQEADQSTE